MQEKTETEFVRMLLKSQLSHWMPEYQNQKTEADCAGVLLAKYFKWDGIAILTAMRVALEDANFHHESAIADSLIKMIERDCR